MNVKINYPNFGGILVCFNIVNLPCIRCVTLLTFGTGQCGSYKIRPCFIRLVKFLAKVRYYYWGKVFTHSSLFYARTFA